GCPLFRAPVGILRCAQNDTKGVIARSMGHCPTRHCESEATKQPEAATTPTLPRATPAPRHCEERARGWNSTERHRLQACCRPGQPRPPIATRQSRRLSADNPAPPHSPPPPPT